MHSLHLIFTRPSPLDGKGGKGKDSAAWGLGLGKIKDIGYEAFCAKGNDEMCASGLGGLQWDPENPKEQEAH